MGDLAGRIRAQLGPKGATELKMFGGHCFMLNGNMVAGTMNTGALLARVDKARHDAFAARPHASGMVHGGRAMAGFILVDPKGVASDRDLAAWLDEAAGYVAGLPPKVKKAKPAKTRRAR